MRGFALARRLTGSAVALAALAAPGGAAAQAPADDGIALEEIIVTARRRSESLQEVPVAVTAFSGESLERAGLKETEDLFSRTPGLYFSQAGQRQNDEQFFLTVRGVGTSPVVEPSVAVFVDGVYVPSLGWSADFLEVERVEILRGPQGALFGRNTEAGALNIVSRKPGDETEGKATLELAEFGTVQASGSVSGPAAEGLYVSISAFAATTDGYMHNAARDEDQDNRDKVGGRAIVVAEPSETARFTLTLDYRSSEGRFDAQGDADPALRYRIVDPTAPRRGTFVEGHALAGRKYTTFAGAEQTIDVENYGAGLTTDLDLGSFGLTAITGYRALRAEDLFDIDGIPTADATNRAVTRQEIASQELRLTGETGPSLRWILGTYGYLETLEQNRLSRLNSGVGGALIVPGRVSDNVSIDRKGLAGFGQATYAVTEKLELALGARYSYEHVDQTPLLQVDVTVPAPGGSARINFLNNTAQSDSFKGFSPMGSLRYLWSDAVTAYASVATGFKGGGFSKMVPNTPAQNLPVENETSVNYEVGVKAELLDQRLQVNAALFYTELEDQQLNTRLEVAPGTYAPTTTNAGKGHSQGIELEAAARPTEALTVRGTLSYTEAEFDEYIAVPAVGAAPAYDRSGQPFPEVPKWLGSVSAEYRFQLGQSGLDLIPSVSWRYVGKKFIGEGNASLPFIDIPAYDVTDAQLTLEGADWSATLFARNLFDTYYVENKFYGQPALSVPGNRAYRKPGAPRQVGIRTTIRF
ncbi:MAG TPA: TonB-dependent receptor [Azospirillaceae bacterium]|nr:TonB-dependent receptor [Azospirillaceae bacterium]